MKIKLWDCFPVCPSELAKQLFPPLRNSCWKGIKKNLFPRKEFTFHSQEIKRTGNRHILSISFGLVSKAGFRVSRWDSQLWVEHSCGCGFLPLWFDEKPLFGQERFTFSMCCTLQYTTLVVIFFLGPALSHFVRSQFVRLSKGAQCPLCTGSLFYWFFWKANLFWICWILLNSFSVLCDKGLCQERYKGRLWCVGNPFLLVRHSVMHIFPLLVACTSLLHCLYYSNSSLTQNECCTL